MSAPWHDSWKDYAEDLSADVHRLHERIGEMEAERKGLERERNDYMRLYSQERAHVAAIKRELRDAGALVVPLGDRESGYECPTDSCFAPIDHPFDQRYCPWCGAKFDWWGYDEYSDSAMQDDGDWLREQAVGACS